MTDTIISVENLSKRYRLGQIGMSSLRESAERFFRRAPAKHNEQPSNPATQQLPSKNEQPSNPATQQLPSKNEQPGNPATEQRPSKNEQLNNQQRTTGSPDFWALRDISFEVKRGEVLGVIGRNGAGKSTLLKILSRITEPTSGRAILRGRVASLLEVGTGFHPELTGRENIFLNGAILGMRKAEITSKFDEIVAFAELDKFIDTPVKRYSSGMYVRLAFAVAAHLDPEILLVDEVLAVGDFEFRKKCLGKMNDVSNDGRTILFVSHDMGNISNLCTKTVWLESGKIQAYGMTHKVVSKYLINGNQTVAEKKWNNTSLAPGNEHVRLDAVRITSNGMVTSDIMIDEEVTIEMDYWNLIENNKIIGNIHLWDNRKGLVLVSGNMASASLKLDAISQDKRAKGLFRSVCKIPANFLNNEEYSVDIGLQNEKFEWQVWEKQVLSFVVHETGAMKKEYMGTWGGVVRPKLEWITTRLESKSIPKSGER